MKYLLRGLAAGVAGGAVVVLLLGGVTSAHKGGVITETRELHWPQVLGRLHPRAAVASASAY